MNEDNSSASLQMQDIRAISALQSQTDDLSSRILEVEADVKAAHNKANGIINTLDVFIDDTREAIQATEKAVGKLTVMVLQPTPYKE